MNNFLHKLIKKWKYYKSNSFHKKKFFFVKYWAIKKDWNDNKKRIKIQHWILFFQPYGLIFRRKIVIIIEF